MTLKIDFKLKIKNFKLRSNWHLLAVFALSLATIGLLGSFLFGTKPPKVAFPKAEIVVQKKDYKVNEKVEFVLKLNEGSLKRVLAPGRVFAQTSSPAVLGVWNSGEMTVKASLVYDKLEMKSMPVTITRQDAQTFLLAAQVPQNSFRPGLYQMKVTLQEGEAVRDLTQNFNWGVLAVNTNKNLYAPGEEVKISFGVLNERGTTICDASIKLKIKNEKLKIDEVLSTENQRIKPSGQCARDNVTYTPDYAATYAVGAEGEYQLEVTAETANGQYTTKDVLQVTNNIPYDIERVGPTRINPTSPYDFQIKITANQNFDGQVVENVPPAFTIKGKDLSQSDQTPKTLTWAVRLKKGETKILTYSFDAPDISPEFFLLGPLRLVDTRSGQAGQTQSVSSVSDEFTEGRQWQIASDGVGDVILLWDTSTSTPSGWTCISCTAGDPYYQIYPRGAAAYSGSTGGSATHTHTLTYVSESASGEGTGAYDNGTGGIYVAQVGHTHGGLASQTVGPVSNDPSFRTLRFIRSNGTPSTIPSGAIGIFDTTTMPANWQLYSTEDTYFLQGDDIIETGGSNTHTHSITATASNTNSSVQLTANTGTNAPSTTHGHPCTGTSDSVDKQPPYKEVVFGKATQDTTAPAGLIAMFDATPPAGWSSVSGASQALNGYFIKGNSSAYGATGGNTNHPTHAQVGLSCTQTSNTTSVDGSPAQDGTALAHTHTINASFSSDASVPVYRDTIFGQKSPEVSGTIYNGNGTVYDCSANNLTVAVSVEGAAKTTSTCTTSAGTYAVGVGATTAGNVITVFLDDETPNASTVTKAAGTSGATGIDLYVDHLIVRQENGVATTNQELDKYDYVTGGSDGDVPFQVDLSGTYNLTVRSGTRLWVWTGKTFDPGGTVTTDANMGDLIVGASATAYLDTATSAIGGDVIASGSSTLNIQATTTVAGGDITTTGTSATITYTNTPTLTLRGTGSIGGGTTPSITFYSLTAGDATTATTTTSTSFTVASTLTVGTGSSFTGSSSTVTMSGGSISNSGTLSFNGLTISGTTTTSSNFTVTGAITIGASGNLSPSGGTITINGGSISNSNTLVFSGLTIDGTVTSSSSFSVGGALTVNGGGNFSPSGGTVTMNNGGSIVNSGTLAFQNLAIAASAGVTTASTFSVVADLTVNSSGTLSTTGGTGTITVNGSVTGTGTLTISNGTFEQRVAAAKNFGTTSGTANWTFATLIFSNSGAAGYTVTTQGGTGTITVSTLLQVGKVGDGQAITLDAGARTWTLSSTTGTPFSLIGSSVLTGNTSTFAYTGVYAGGNTAIQATTGSSYYYNLTINAAETFDAGGALVVNHDLTVTTGTVQMGANNLTVGSDTATGDIAVALSQSLTQSASGTTTVKTFSANTATVGGAGTLTFYNLSLSPTNSGGTIRLGSAASQTISVLGDLTIGNGAQTVTVDANTNDPVLTVTGNVSISATGTFQAPSYTTESFTVGGTYANSGTFTNDGGKVTFNGTGTGKTLGGTMTGSSAFGYLTFNGTSGVSWTFGANAAAIANDLSIAANNTVTAPSTTLNITGNYANSGTFTANSGKVTFDAGTAGHTLSGNMTSTSAFYDLEFNNAAGSWTFGNNSATATRDFIMTAATAVTAPGSTYTLLIGRNFTKTSGTFTHNSGTVEFNDSGQTSTITGSTTFYNLKSTTASKTITFTAGTTQTLAAGGTLTLTGGGCASKITLISSSSPTQWSISVPGAQSVSSVDVKDSNSSGAGTITATDSKSSGNVTGNWAVTGGVCGGVTVSGNAYADEGTTVWTGCNGSTANISLVVNGGTAQNTSCNASTGAYTFYTVTTALNNPVSVFMNATAQGSAVTVAADSTTNITLNPRVNIIWVKTEGAVASITNTNLGHCDSTDAGIGCSNVPYSMSANNLTAVTGVEFHVESNKTYDPGGSLTTQGTGNLHVASGATAYLDVATSAIANDILVDASATLNIQATTTIGGNITTGNSATVTYTNTPTVTVSGTGSLGGGTSPSISFYNLTIAGTQTIASAFSVAGDLTVNGTMQGSAAVTTTVTGSLVGTGTVNMTGGTVEQRVAAAAKNFGGSGGNAWTFATLIFSNSSGASGYTVTTQTDAGGITVSSLLQIGKVGDTQTTTLNAGNRVWTLSSTTGTPFSIIGSSSLTASTSTFTYTGIYASGNTTIQNATYYNLTTNAAETFDAGGTTTVSNTLTVTTGTVQMGVNDLNVGSDSYAGNIAVAASQSLTQTGGTTTIKTPASTGIVGGGGTLTFYNLTLAPTTAGGTIQLGSDVGQTITVSGDLTVGNGTQSVIVDANTTDPVIDVNGSFLINPSGTFQASSDSIFYVAQNFTNNGTFTHDNGTVVMDSATTSDITGAATDPTPAITFYNFTCTTAGKTLQFGASKVIRFDTGGLLTVTGTSGSKITIKSNSTSTQWKVDRQGTVAITYTTVQDSGGLTGSVKITLDSTNGDGGGNNSAYWEFQVGKRIKANVRIKAGVRIK